MYFDHWAKQQELIKFVNKPGELLSRLTKGLYKLMHIMDLRDRTDQLTQPPQQITNILEAYYTGLYSEDPKDQATAQTFLDRLTLPKLSMSQIKYLNAPISKEEILFMIKTLANNKASGSDGYTTEFYKATMEDILLHLLSIYNTM